MKLLLEKGADPKAKDYGGQTPLWRAAGNGHEAVVKLLLDKGEGADPEDKDNYEGRTKKVFGKSSLSPTVRTPLSRAAEGGGTRRW